MLSARPVKAWDKGGQNCADSLQKASAIQRLLPVI